MHTAGKGGIPWECSGVIVRVTATEEVALEMQAKKGTAVPSDVTEGYAAELLWNSTAYDRMQAGLKMFAENPDCMSLFLYHQLLGHDPETGPLRLPQPAVLQAPNMPQPNHSQIAALEVSLQQPFTMIQGPPGTGKTVTSTTLVWLLHQATRDKVLMAAPSNVAVDHLAEKIAATGLKVRILVLLTSSAALWV
jgi:regulator of nonsense transcripts 1